MPMSSMLSNFTFALAFLLNGRAVLGVGSAFTETAEPAQDDAPAPLAVSAVAVSPEGAKALKAQLDARVEEVKKGPGTRRSSKVAPVNKTALESPRWEGWINGFHSIALYPPRLKQIERYFGLRRPLWTVLESKQLMVGEENTPDSATLMYTL